MKARAPGKLILSGEHAVVHGRPALVMAVDRYAEASITSHDDGTLLVHFPRYCGDASIPVGQLPGFKQRADRNYERFLEGHLSIREVLEHPVELIYYAVGRILDEAGQPSASGWRIDLSTDLPIGCGMGSSAAVIVGVLGAFTREVGLDVIADDLFHWAWDVEKLQHGRPSGADPYISVHGGLVRFQGGRAQPLKPPSLTLHLVHTGVPEATTGECVMEVSRRFAGDRVWEAFERVTLALEDAVGRADDARIREGVRENHRLLCRIGVVPDRVRSFVSELERDGAAAKICGAGSISGDAGGMVLILADEPPNGLCAEYGYALMAVEPEPEGWRMV